MLRAKYPEAIEFAKRSLSHYTKMKDKRQISQSYNLFGSIYASMGNNERSISAYYSALRFAQESNYDFGMATAYNNLGARLEIIRDTLSAFKAYFKALTYFHRSDSKSRIASVYNNLGVLHKNTGNNDSAIYYYSRSCELYKEMNDVFGIATSYMNLGGIYYDNGDMDKVLEYDLRSLELYESVNSIFGQVIALNNIAGDYEKLKQYTKAIEFSKKSLELASAHEQLEDMKVAYQSLAQVAEKMKDFESAYDYFKKFQKMSDSIAGMQNKKNMLELTTKYRSEEQEKEILWLNERDSKNRIVIYAVASGLFMILLLAAVLLNRYRVKQRANKLLKAQNREINTQKLVIEGKNKDITDSIRYAQRIQNAILAPDHLVKKIFPDSFIFFRPKDIVSGDFYWFEKWGNEIFFAAVDCTGHGVPGALMSVVGYNILNQALNEHGLTKPNLILNSLNKGISRMMRQESAELSATEVKDGMDIALCSFDREKMQLNYSGAFNSLYIIRHGKLMVIKPDKIPIGSYKSGDTASYSLNEFKMEKGDCIYIFTDGYADQFGGPHGKKFKYKQFQEILIWNSEFDMKEQLFRLETELERWKGKLEQVDDILVIGIKV